MKRALVWCLLLTASGLLATAAAGSRLPSPMPIHWGLSGQPDGWGPRAVGMLLGPAFGIGLPLVMALVWWRGVRTGSSPVGEATMARLMVLTAAFFLGLHLLVLQAALHPAGVLAGHGFLALLGLFWIGLAGLLTNLAPNPLIGIRTRWTRRDPVVWDRTHRLARTTITGSGLLALAIAAVARRPEACWAVGLPVLLTGVLWPAVASAFIARAVDRAGQGE